MTATATSLAAGSAAPTRATAGPPAGPWYARIPAPYYFSSLITLILVFGEWFHGIVGGYERLAMALGTAIVAEIVLSRLLRGSWPHLLSAYITGNSVVILTKPTAGVLWPFFMGAFIAIASKYVIQVKRNHIWNPTNFSITLMVLLAPSSVSILSHEWSNTLFIVLLIYAIGLMVVQRAKVLHMSVTYVVTFAALALLRSGVDWVAYKREIAPLTGAMYTLFIFFMITDPRTVVATRNGRILVAVLIGAVDAGIRMLGDAGVPWVAPLLPAPPLVALFVVGPIAKVISLKIHENPPARP